MSHEHSHHDHGTENVSDRALLGAVIVNGGLSVFEFAAGLISGSVALMADALHNTNDAAALVIAYIARRIARKGADERFTFGYRRAELIGAMIQLTALILLGLYLVYEAVHRVFDPQPLLGVWIMAASAVALVVDLATAWFLWELDEAHCALEAHVVIDGEHGECPAILKTIKQILHDRFEIAHATIEMEIDAEQCAADICLTHGLQH